MDWFSLAHASQLWLFFVLVLGIIALPGMDMAFVLGSTLVDGFKGGVAALAGVVAGGVAHIQPGGTVRRATDNHPTLPVVVADGAGDRT